MGEPIRASFPETVEHYLEAEKNSPKRSNFLAVAPAVVIICGLILLTLARKDYQKGDRVWWLAPAAGLGAMAYWLWQISPAGQRWLLRKRLRKELKDPPVKAWFEFGDEGFLSTGAEGRSSFHPWPTVPQIVERADGLLIFIDKGVYQWVPARAFDSPAAYEELLKRLQAKVQNFQRLKGG